MFKMKLGGKFVVVIGCLLALIIVSNLVWAGDMSVSAKEALNLLDNDKVVIVDIRSKSFCDITGKAKNSYNIPFYKGDDLLKFLEKVKAAHRGKEIEQILIMCRMGRGAANLVMQYHYAGIINVKSIEGGMHGWLSSGMPIEPCN